MTQRFRAIPTKFKDAMLIEPTVHEDFRGFFKETFRANEYAELGIAEPFVQENVSWSTRHVLRGLHYDFNVAKLVQVVYGRTYHVIVDMREESETFRQWQAFILSHRNHRQVFVPKGFANGFLVLSDQAFVHYKQSAYFNPQTAQNLAWNDPEVRVEWPVDKPILSAQDGGDLKVWERRGR